MKIGLIDVDGHNFPNYALMKISSYHKQKGDDVEWAMPLNNDYDVVYKSKIFTFTPDDMTPWDAKVIQGGTGYDIKSRLPEEIEKVVDLDYSIYPQHDCTLQFFSRGCIRKCPFCLVREKEGYIHEVTPTNLNPNGKRIEVLDNNFFANPSWKKSVEWLLDANQKVKLHGVDVRIINEEQSFWLNKLKIDGKIHIAWDLPQIDLTEKIKTMVTHINPNKITCYVLIGFNSTKEQDLKRVRTLKEFGITPFVQPYRDFENMRTPTQYEKDFARWANRPQIFFNSDFMEYEARKGFFGAEYFK